MKKKYPLITGLVIVVFIILLLAWAPWVTFEFAHQKVLAAIEPCSFLSLSEGVVDIGGASWWLPFGHKLVYTSHVVCPPSAEPGFSRFENATQFFISAFGTVHPIKY